MAKLKPSFHAIHPCEDLCEGPHRFLKLTQSLSAPHPPGTGERRRVDGYGEGEEPRFLGGAARSASRPYCQDIRR